MTALARTSETGKTQRLELREISPTGTVLQRTPAERQGTAFGTLSTQLTTTVAGSSVRAVLSGIDLSGNHLLRLKNATVGVTPTGPVDPEPPAPATCTDLDYSDPGAGTLTFADEFTGTSLNTSRWNVKNNQGLSYDKAWLQAANVSVHDGLLDITGKRQNAGGREWTSGYIDTIGKFSQEYGRWEMRAKVPADETRSKGVWPAFWLRSDTTMGELDIMETYGSPRTQTYNPSRTYAWTIWKDTTRATGSERLHGWSGPQNSGPPIYEDHHVYAMNWSPECITFAIDDRVIATVPMSSEPWLASAIKGKFNIRLNLQIGSSYWGMPNDVETKPEMHYLVDYVRVYAPAG